MYRAPRSPGGFRLVHGQIAAPPFRVLGPQQVPLEPRHVNGTGGHHAVGPIFPDRLPVLRVAGPLWLALRVHAREKLVCGFVFQRDGRSAKEGQSAGNVDIPDIVHNVGGIGVHVRIAGQAVVLAALEEGWRKETPVPRGGEIGRFKPHPGTGPGGRPVGGFPQFLKPVGGLSGGVPGSPGIQQRVHGNDAVTLPGKRGGPRRPEPPGDIDARVLISVPGDSGKAVADAAFAVGAAETAPVSPRGVLVPVIRPGHRPVIASGRQAAVAREIEFDTDDRLTSRIGRLAGRTKQKDQHRQHRVPLSCRLRVWVPGPVQTSGQSYRAGGPSSKVWPPTPPGRWSERLEVIPLLALTYLRFADSREGLPPEGMKQSREWFAYVQDSNVELPQTGEFTL